MALYENKRQRIGKLGEQLAVSFLEKKGLKVVERNWRWRRGEIDFIARSGDCLVFVEVRTRTVGGRQGTALESVDVRKQRQVRTTAEIYVNHHQLFNVAIRFDVVAVTLSEAEEMLEIEHVEYAF
jgi:putative endonuclease